MSDRKRPVGPIVDPLPPGLAPDLRPLFGRWVRLEPVLRRSQAAISTIPSPRSDPEGAVWTYLGYGPFDDYEAFQAGSKKQRGEPRSLVLCLHPPRHREGGRHGRLHASRQGQWRDRDRPYLDVARLAADARGDRGDLSHDASLLRRSWVSAGSNGNAMRSTRPRARRPSASASPTRAFSASISSSRAATATPPGMSMIDKEWPADRRQGSRPGSRTTISTRTGGRRDRCSPC